MMSNACDDGNDAKRDGSARQNQLDASASASQVASRTSPHQSMESEDILNNLGEERKKADRSTHLHYIPRPKRTLTPHSINIFQSLNSSKVDGGGA